MLAATNADVAREVADGRFREDLLYRLNTVEIRLPPLRERREDIADLAAQFLARAHAARRPARRRAAMEALLAHPWPGNVRELEHVDRARGAARAPGDEIEPRRPRCCAAAPRAPPRLEEMTLEQVERYLIERALAAQGGNVSEAARALGLSRSALYRRLAALGVAAGVDRLACDAPAPRRLRSFALGARRGRASRRAIALPLLWARRRSSCKTAGHADARDRRSAAVGFALAARSRVLRPLQTLANLDRRAARDATTRCAAATRARTTRSASR